MTYSNSQVKKAGRTLRKMADGSMPHEDGGYSRAIDVSDWYRAEHQYSLGKATMGLRSMAQTCGIDAQISQRLKRTPMIIRKLVRHPKMQLLAMQDIAGCRAIVSSIDALRELERHIGHAHPPIRSADDYVTNPRSSGYRAVHPVVEYQDRRRVRRKAEIQLRTQVMHAWAVAVERVGDRMHEDIKSGEGPLIVRDWFSAISEAMAVEETGGIVDESVMERIRVMRDEVDRLVVQGGLQNE